MTTSRIESFSDGVFAIAITLLVIEIKVPGDTADLAHKLLELWPSYLGYVISFLLIGLVWANHHVMFERIARGDRVLMFLNMLLLLNVAFLPFVAGVLASAFRSADGTRTAVVLYGATLVVGGIFFNAIWEYARRRPELLSPEVPADEVTAMSRRFLLGPAMYAAGTVLGAFVPILGLVVFAGLILFYWVPPPRLR